MFSFHDDPGHKLGSKTMILSRVVATLVFFLPMLQLYQLGSQFLNYRPLTDKSRSQLPYALQCKSGKGFSKLHPFLTRCHFHISEATP